MNISIYRANVEVFYTTQHSVSPQVLLGESARFDVFTPEGKVIANLTQMSKKKFGVGEKALGIVSIRWPGGVPKDFENLTELPILVMNEQIGVCIVDTSTISIENN